MRGRYHHHRHQSHDAVPTPCLACQAGEHTNRKYPTTVAGAYSSGLRAAGLHALPLPFRWRCALCLRSGTTHAPHARVHRGARQGKSRQLGHCASTSRRHLSSSRRLKLPWAVASTSKTQRRPNAGCACDRQPLTHSREPGSSAGSADAPEFAWPGGGPLRSRCMASDGVLIYNQAARLARCWCGQPRAVGGSSGWLNGWMLSPPASNDKHHLHHLWGRGPPAAAGRGSSSAWGACMMRVLAARGGGSRSCGVVRRRARSLLEVAACAGRGWRAAGR